LAPTHIGLLYAAEFTSIRMIREAMDHPADFDQALIAPYTSQAANLVPWSCQANLTSADPAAAVRYGGKDKHLVSDLGDASGRQPP
jgi:hypothetical protein